jgi:hypothetical protein
MSDDDRYVVCADYGWLDTRLEVTEHILCAGLWPKVEAEKYATAAGGYVEHAAVEWENWCTYRTPSPLEGTMMEYVNELKDATT